MSRPRHGIIISGATFLMLIALSQQIMAQSITRESPSAKHAYGIALDYCKERGGLAQCIVQGEVVKFSCGDDLTQVVTISP